jgi:thymidine kinase
MISITSTDIIGRKTITTIMDSLSPSYMVSSSSPSSSSPPSPPPPSRSLSPLIKSEPTLENKIQITQKTKKKGYLELILGPMFSGKTSTLKKIYDQCMYCNIPVMVINYSADKRYSNEDVMSTHDKIMIPCIMVNTIAEIIDNYGERLSSSEVILINEGQFFSDIEYVISLVEEMHKRVYICGLDGDFQKNKIGSLFELIPYCDNICKLKSLCSECRDGTPGLFSYRITNEVSQVVIGINNYKPLCRVCYKRLTIEKESKYNARMANGIYNYDV